MTDGDSTVDVDPRPVLSRAEFQEYATYVDRNWWLVGESLIHRPSVMNIEGWNLYGHPGNAQLTEEQRVLMMWSDLVGQVSNGGFMQFVDNYEMSLKLAYTLILRLEWPDLTERFDRAFREQAGDPAAPKLIRPTWLSEQPVEWAASRQRFLQKLARAEKAKWLPVTKGDIAAVAARYSDWELQSAYMDAVREGEIEAGAENPAVFIETAEKQAQAFDDWLYLTETKQASARFVGAFIAAHRDQLCRFSD